MKKYIVAVDVGSSEVVVAVGSVADDGKMNIEAIVAEPTEGMAAGLVDNSQIVGKALSAARARAEQIAGVAITDAYVTLSGKFVRCARYTDHVFVENNENCISQRDLNALRERMRNVKAADGEMIMDFFPLCYKGDSGAEMKNPVGCYSKQLSSTYNFILCDNTAKDRLRHVFLDAGIKIRELYAGASVVAESIVTSEEMDEGIAVVDIGSGVTDVAIYYGGVLCYMASIPMGGSAVNADIRVYNGYIPPKVVEKLKCQCGSAVVDLTPDDMIHVQSRSRTIKPIPRLNLASVIEARMTDIAEYVWGEIRDAGYAKKLTAGIVITGGVANLKNVAELFQRVTGQETRVACAEIGVASDSFEKVASPNLTLAVSLLLRGARIGACPIGVLQGGYSAVASQPAEPAPAPTPATPAAPAYGKPTPAPATTPEPEPEPEPEEDDWEQDDLDDIPERKGKVRWIDKLRGAFDKAFSNPEEDEDGDF